MKAKMFTKILLFILSLILTLSSTGCATLGERFLEGYYSFVESHFGEDYYLYEPEIKYGEFPFSITYEIDGERITVEDTYICEFERVYYDVETGKYRRIWNGYLRNTGKDSIEIVTLTDSDNEIEIYLDVGYPELYMENEIDIDEEIYPIFYQVKYYSYGKSIDNLEEQYIERFGLKIIDYIMSKPIVNSFGTEKND